jgi:diguanylate cyclase (GGDEF)-like protein/PAS domain S-box-containing protein
MNNNIKNKKIFIVEDSFFAANVVKNFLNEFGYEVEISFTGEDALQKIENGFLPNLILMDIQLSGGMDGIDVTRKILELKDLPVVFLTASTSDKIIDKIREVKAYGFVLKNTDKTALLSTVEMAIKLHEASIHVKMFERLFEISHEELYIFHPKSLKFITANPAARKNLGYSLEQLITTTLLDIKLENDLQIFQKFIDQLLSGEQEQILFQTVHRRKNGTIYPAKIVLQLFNYEGEDLCLISAVDITEQKRLEEDNKQKEERLHLMVKGIPSPAWLISREYNILLQNKAAETLFKTKIDDYCFSWLPDSENYFHHANEVLKTNRYLNYEIELSGNIWDTRLIPLGEDIYLYYATDVTKYKKTEEELLILSITDTLTNVYNRRYFMQKLEEEIERANRGGGKFSVVMMDIDHFKNVNDQFGHNLGDIVLKKSMSDVFINRIRKLDTLARWGGEEFVILLPETAVDKAVMLAEELRENLSKIIFQDVVKITASFGVAGYCIGDTVDKIMQKADNQMYKAKSDGRNCVRYILECE